MRKKQILDKRIEEFNLKPVKRVQKTFTNHYNCKRCGVSFDLRGELTDHINKHKVLDGTAKFRCEKCGDHFKRTRDLNAHLKKHEPKMEYKCEICDKILTSEGFLKRHLRTHTKPKRGYFRCQICHKVLTCSKTLQRHTVASHPGQFTTKACPSCGMRFFTKETFVKHILTHIKQENLEAEENPLNQTQAKINEQNIMEPDVNLNNIFEVVNDNDGEIVDELEPPELIKCGGDDDLTQTEKYLSLATTDVCDMSSMEHLLPLGDKLKTDVCGFEENKLDGIFKKNISDATNNDRDTNVEGSKEKAELKMDGNSSTSKFPNNGADNNGASKKSLLEQLSLHLIKEGSSIFNNDIPPYPF